jgi:hypothetical protein
MTKTASALHSFRQAYLLMAPFYRPAAPGDGMGHVSLTPAQCRDRKRLEREAGEYAGQFIAEEDTCKFVIGCSDLPGKLQRAGMTEFAEDLRHRCRNPRCRMKLTAPVANPHKAFCTRGCHSSFHLKRCLVCENDKPAGSTARRKLCRRPKCEGRYRKNSAHYSFLGAAQIPPLRRTYQEVPNPRALKVPVLTTDLGISLLARKSPPRSTTAPRCRSIPI